MILQAKIIGDGSCMGSFVSLNGKPLECQSFSIDCVAAGTAVLVKARVYRYNMNGELQTDAAGEYIMDDITFELEQGRTAQVTLEAQDAKYLG
jgi:hypothetical protein